MKSWLTPEGPGPSPAYLEEYIGDRVVNVATVFIVLLVITVFTRFYARTTVISALGVEDWLTIPSLISTIGICIVNIISNFPAHLIGITGLTLEDVKKGAVGYHVAAASMKRPGWPLVFGKSLFALQLLYIFATSLPKMSILFMYLRIFPFGALRTATYVHMGLVVGLAFSVLVVTFVQCSPIAYIWDRSIPGGKCIDTKAVPRWIALPNILIDVGLLILPLPMVWNLKRPVMQKLGLTLTFMAGGVGIVAACIRMHEFFNVDAYTDPTYTIVTLINWTVIEASFYLIAACLPTFRPILFKTIPEIWNRTMGSKGSKSSKESSYWLASNRQESNRWRNLERPGKTPSPSPSRESWTSDTAEHGAAEWTGERSYVDHGAKAPVTSIRPLPKSSHGGKTPHHSMDAYYQHV